MKSSLHIALLMLILMACRTPQLVIAYKNPNLPEHVYSRIVVTAMLQCGNDSFRRQIEQRVVGEMLQRGLPAVAIADEFPEGRQAAGDITETYRQLCLRGVDAVVTVALIEGSRENQPLSGVLATHPNDYYFERVWNYPQILAHCPSDSPPSSHTYYWEVILFDLATLEAQCAVQTRSFTVADSLHLNRDFESRVIRRLVKERVLIQVNRSTAKPGF